MPRSAHLLIIGGGISGLTLANLIISANPKVKFHLTIFEQRSAQHSPMESSGIALWPPSQFILKNIPQYQKTIEQIAYSMPLPSYRDSRGRILATASKTFNERFPVQCLNRADLLKMLSDGLENRAEVEFVRSEKINEYQRRSNKIIISARGKLYEGDLVIACDGIHSKIRNCLMKELSLPPVHATALGYTYFRANAQLVNEDPALWNTAFEVWGRSQSKKYGTNSLRFGYVPLKPPDVFWFIAIKTQKQHPFLSPINQTEWINEDTKQFLLALVKDWKPVPHRHKESLVDYERLIHASNKILRTDIAKIKGVEKFPWASLDKRIVLVGDAAHATAPNIAQGAGLSIEDAAYVAAHLNRVDYLNGLSNYEKDRKPRCIRVQRMADFIATVGQIKNPLLMTLRNIFMRTATTLSPVWQQRIFEYLVSFSLGGSKKSTYWQLPSDLIANPESSLFGRIFPNFPVLQPHIKSFKTATGVRSGRGFVTLRKPSYLAKILELFLHFPQDMTQQDFYAQVVDLSNDIQVWKRIFGFKTSQQKTYTTTHSIYCDFKRQSYLSEGIGGVFNKVIQFLYKVEVLSDQSLNYRTEGITFFNLFKIPFPLFLLPQSNWVEKPTQEGWLFEGKISLPIIGSILHYYGDFKIDKQKVVKEKRVLVIGGTGMIGKALCLEFIRKGYEVYCLSRALKKQSNIEGVKIRLVNENWSDLIDKNTIIINLSGENPGFKRWSASFKLKIAQSRLRMIDIIAQNINRADEKPLKYLQASAAGYYGDAGDKILTEESASSMKNEAGTRFRVEVCKEIEEKANLINCNVVNLRLGHVLSNRGGLLPYLRLASLFGITRLGSGNQFIPFVHINDVAKAIEFIAEHDKIKEGPVNITAPTPCRNGELLSALSKLKWFGGFSIPAFILRLLIGQSSVVLTDSERVKPKRLLENGFTFDFKTIQDALAGLQ